MGKRRVLLLLGALLVGAAILAHAMVPSRRGGEEAPIDLEALVPQRFAGWQMVQVGDAAVALPLELRETQDHVYDQTLARTYVNGNGDRIMLTIAYGANQSRTLQVHRPEVCYSALGFQVLTQRKVDLALATTLAPVPAMQLVAVQNERNEPVTYWIRIGERVVRGNVELGLARMSYGLRGIIPDGLLFRVSNITARNEAGFALQRAFIEDLLTAMPPERRQQLVGRLALPAG